MKHKVATIKKILERDPNFNDRYIPDYRELQEIIQTLKRSGYRTVLTQGVFDLLHINHLLYLEKAKSYGDILIVGVDSDDLTHARKGEGRPIVPQEERLQVLAYFRFVDIMTLRTLECDTDALVEVVSPDVFIVSETTKDFPPEKLQFLKKFCGEIVVLPAQGTISTTARIRNVAVGGAHELAKEIERVINAYIRGGKAN